MPKKVANIPDDDHVMRHVGWNRLLKDEDDNVLGFLPQAFELRPEEDALSVSWIEYYEDPATRVRDAVWGVRRARDVRPKSAFAIASVGRIKETCSNVSNAKVRAVPEPLDKWPAHAGIRRLPHDDLDLLEVLATKAFTEMVLNRDIPDEASE